MNIQEATMNIPWGEAQTQFQAYRRLVKDTPKRATKDDVSLYRALWQITRGQKVIDINKAITSGGLNGQGLPHLAIGRADREEVYCRVVDGKYLFTPRRSRWGRIRAGEISVRFPSFVDAAHGRAQTPLIPAKHRPDGSLEGYFILWEAEWQRMPPTDPILLRPISGPFFVALAQWDLTPLEQAVLRQRL